MYCQLPFHGFRVDCRIAVGTETYFKPREVEAQRDGLTQLALVGSLALEGVGQLVALNFQA
jgi:hypothetical protein